MKTSAKQIRVIGDAGFYQHSSDTLKDHLTGIDVRLGTPWFSALDVANGNPPSTSMINVTSTTNLLVGDAVRITQTTPGTIYGQIVSRVVDTSITISGPALNTAEAVDALDVADSASQIVVFPLFVASTYGDGANDLLANDMKTYSRWKHRAAYLVGLEATHQTADTGAAQPKVNAKVAGSLVLSQDTNLGIQLSAIPGTWTANAGANINSSNYGTAFGDVLELSCTVAGSNGDAANLTCHLIFVLA